MYLKMYNLVLSYRLLSIDSTSNLSSLCWLSALVFLHFRLVAEQPSDSLPCGCMSFILCSQAVVLDRAVMKGVISKAEAKECTTEPYDVKAGMSLLFGAPFSIRRIYGG